MDNVNQQVPPVPPQPPVKPANNLSFFKIIAYGLVIVSVGVSIAVGGYLLGANKPNKPTVQVAATPTPTPDPTANWQTYTTSNFTFKYPQDWDVAQLSSLALPNLIVAPKANVDALRKVNFQVGGGKQSVISIIGPSSGDSAPFVLTSDETKSVASKSVIIAGLNAIEYTSIYKIDLPGVQSGDMVINTVLESAGKKYSIGLVDIKYKDTYDQILATFKFNGQAAQNSSASDPTAGWKTYRDSVNKIEFKYPDLQKDNYIGGMSWQWPPKIISVSVSSVWNCPVINVPSKPSQAEQIIGGNKYCVANKSEGAAGTNFQTTKYTSSSNGRLITLEIAYSLANCGNYSNKTIAQDCKNKENTFTNSLSSIIDQIFSTFKFIN